MRSDESKLLEDFEPMIRYLAYRVYGSTHHRDYDDCLQVGRIETLRAAKRHDPTKGKLSSYVYACVHGVMRNYRDKLSREVMYDNIPEVIADRHEDSIDQEYLDLHHKLEQLSNLKQKEALTLRVFNRMSTSEVAEKLGVTTTSISVWTARAIGELASLYGKPAPSERAIRLALHCGRNKPNEAAMQKSISSLIARRSKKYIVTDPSGKTSEIINLNEFCKENGLTQSAMCNLAAGKGKQHKGWKCSCSPS